MRGIVLILRSLSNDLSISLSVINELIESLGCSLLITLDKSFRSSYTCSSNIDGILFFDLQLRNSLCFENPKTILINFVDVVVFQEHFCLPCHILEIRIDTVVERIVYKFSEINFFADISLFDIKSKCIGNISFEHSLCALQK